MTTNLLHNAIVHNLTEHGTVQVNTAADPESVTLTVENTGDKLSSQLVQHSPSRSSEAPSAYAVIMPVSASAWRSSRASPRHTTEPSRWWPPGGWDPRFGATSRRASHAAR